MEIKRCERGHLYDAEINSTCPQCQEEGYAGNTGSRTSAHKETALFVGTKSAAENCHPITPAGTGGTVSYTHLGTIR